MAQSAISMCLDVGYVAAMLRIARGMYTSPQTLRLGFDRFWVLLRAAIFRGLITTGVTFVSMYAGIMIDTNNFMNRTGVRTFEAAAFLRRCGADITYVRKLNRDDFDSYREKSKIVSNANIRLCITSTLL